MMSLQALKRVYLLSSHESVLRILFISPNKNFLEHWLCHSALYLIWVWCFPWFRHAVPYALQPKELQEDTLESVSHFHRSCSVTCLLCLWVYFIHKIKIVFLNHKFENSIFNIHLLKNHHTVCYVRFP